jgi:hypothetical protein
MKIAGLALNKKSIIQLLLGALFGALIGFGIEYRRGVKIAVFLCCLGSVIAAIIRLKGDQRKEHSLYE